MEPTFLQADERPLRVERRHPLSALDAWLGILFVVLLVAAGAFVVAGFVTAKAVPYAVAAVLVASVLGAAAAVAVGFRVSTSLNVVTAERVYHAHGKLRFFLSQTTYDRVTDLHVHQSVFGRRFGFGTVLVQTAGQGVALVGVRDPLGTKRAIEEAREAMVRSLVSTHARATRAAAGGAKVGRAALANAAFPTPAARMGGPPAWTGAPSLASMVTQVLPMVIFLVPFVLFTSIGTALVGRAAFLAPAAVLLVVAILVANAILRLRTTHYEVHAWGVAVASGWLSRSRVEARYEKVTDVAVTQGVWGRMLGFGTIRINTAGSNEAPITFLGVRDPDRVKAIVDGARQGGGP
ncbi:MAG: PH domain-containing protein [Candidatus Thermoplasmatota archaeon]